MEVFLVASSCSECLEDSRRDRMSQRRRIAIDVAGDELASIYEMNGLVAGFRYWMGAIACRNDDCIGRDEVLCCCGTATTGVVGSGWGRSG